MKLKKEFVTHESGGEQIMVGTGGSGFSGLVRSNRTAADIVEILKAETTPEQIVDAMAAKYDVSREVLKRDVLRVIDTLRGIGAIDE